MPNLHVFLELALLETAGTLLEYEGTLPRWILQRIDAQRDLGRMRMDVLGFGFTHYSDTFNDKLRRTFTTPHDGIVIPFLFYDDLWIGGIVYSCDW